MKDKLYFDGQCPLCRREIRYLKRQQKGGLEFVDIHHCGSDVNAVSRRAMLKVLHLKTSSGDWLTGLDATVRAWSHTRWGWLFKPLRWSLLRDFADRIYIAWAVKRFQRHYGCSPCMGGEE